MFIVARLEGASMAVEMQEMPKCRSAGAQEGRWDERLTCGSSDVWV